MSRIGKMPVTLPSGVDVKVESGLVTVKGPKGELKQAINKDMIIKIDDGVLTVDRPSESKEHKSMHGLSRKLIANMVEGVTDGFKKDLEIVGIGYRGIKEGNKLVLNLGFSHQVEIEDPQDIETTMEGTNKISVLGIDKQLVGQHAANIRKIRPPEPYKGKGVRYAGEYIKLKEGKSGAS